ncbi:hypothetical protein JTE90_008049 [Oedothorax gibbosus]|uniref:Uncharacterized protein n=1 Tax=Oedothorax gibbosus TaxID=931172 RepID=A0AAV6UXW1_9ARAC|nr:hypothetical protein JTE90_008049 [Oedothorax gibbosus]
MRSFMILVSAVVLMVEYSSAKGYDTGSGDIVPGYDNGMDSNSRYGGSQIGKLGNGAYGNVKPIPYNAEYNTADEQGNHQFRQEQGDGNGNVRGSYGYRDIQGLYRTVQYVAGRDGFKASVLTNEPGTDGKENPAGTVMNVQKTPAGIVDKYTRRNSGFVGIGGHRSAESSTRQKY